MTWIDVEEKDPLWWGLIVTACGVASAVLVYQRHTFSAALFTSMGVSFAIFLVRKIQLQLWIRGEPRQAAKLVLSWFRQQFPEDRVVCIAVRAIEPERYVIAVYYERGTPTPRRYFAIARPTLTQIQELPPREWWPRGSSDSRIPWHMAGRHEIGPCWQHPDHSRQF